MSHRHNKELRKVRANARMANRPPETPESILIHLTHLPKNGKSIKEIAKLKAKYYTLTGIQYHDRPF